MHYACSIDGKPQNVRCNTLALALLWEIASDPNRTVIARGLRPVMLKPKAVA